MRFRNAFRLFINNFKSTYVILLFRLVIFLITGSVAGVILVSGITSLLESAEMDLFLASLQELPSVFFSSASYADFDVLFREALDGIVQSLGGVFGFLNTHLTEIILSVVGFILLYLADQFLNGLAMFAFGNILNDKMSQYADTPFFLGFLHNIGTAALYQVVYVPLSFVYDLLSIVLCYLIFFRLFSFISILLALFFAVIFLICTQALKLSIVSDWMPAIIADGKKLKEAIKESFKMGKKHFLSNFSNYLLAIYCILAFNVLFAAASFFTALLITVPASFIFLTCLQFASYYALKGKRYFLSYTNICEFNTPENGCFLCSDCHEKKNTERQEEQD